MSAPRSKRKKVRNRETISLQVPLWLITRRESESGGLPPWPSAAWDNASRRALDSWLGLYRSGPRGGRILSPVGRRSGRAAPGGDLGPGLGADRVGDARLCSLPA